MALSKGGTHSSAKARTVNIFSLASPHMRTFHVTWIGFFSAFFAATSTAVLNPRIRDLLNLTSADALLATLAGFMSNVIARCIVGVVCDLYGHRYAHAGLLLLTTPAVFMMATVRGASGFVATSFVLGISLGSFVTTTYSAFAMFSPFLSGTSTSIVAGWGNVGGGMAELVLPAVFAALAPAVGASDAWRLTLYLPAMLMLLCASMVLWQSQDYPDGQVWQRIGPRRSARREIPKLLYFGVCNYRTWMLMLLYAACFGAHVTMFAVLPSFFMSQFGMQRKEASYVTAAFGSTVIFARPLGGISSDWLGRQFGMRGRLWLVFVLVNLQGVMCIVLGLLNQGFVASIVSCVAFSVMVQMSEGATIAVACFVSFRAQGTVQGLVGAAGPLGAFMYTSTFFNISFLSNSQGFIWMGIWTCASSMATLMIAFPMWGSIMRRSSVYAVEEDYYGSEWTREEVDSGDAADALQFAAETISERGRRSLIALMHDSKQGEELEGETRDTSRHWRSSGADRVEPELPGQLGEMMRQRLAMLDDADEAQQGNWNDFISMNAPAHKRRTE